MATKNKTDLKSDVDISLASNQPIIASVHRGLEKDIIDSYEDFVGSYTTAQIAALVGMTTRQIVYDTDIKAYYYYDGTRWLPFSNPKYKVYTALLTQTSTNAPVATVLENTLGGTVVWSYSGVGGYEATLAGAFTASKTDVSFGNVGSMFIVTGNRTTDNTVAVGVFTWNALIPDWAAEDGILSECRIEIRVYY